MEDDASRAESGSVSGSTHTIPALAAPDQPEMLIPSFSPSSAPSSPTPVGTLTRLGLRGPASPSASAAAPGSPVDRGQVSAITVVALLDKLVHMLEAVQDNQRRMEQRQADLEGAVRGVQGDVGRLSKSHAGTSCSVGRLLERSRKTGTHLKEVRERLDRQAVQVKRLEANHGHLLKRNHFKVIIFQEDNEIPSSVMVKDSLKTPQPSQYDAESCHPAPSVAESVDGFQARDEGLHSINLSSDEDEDLAALQEDCEMLAGDDELSVGTSRTFERRADKFKRNSLKKVDSLKKAFSRQSIEKKVSQITTKMVPPEKRDKIKKSLSPNQPKSPTAKSSSFKVSPMTFNVKKVRDGEACGPDVVSPVEDAHVEIPALGSLDAVVRTPQVYACEGAVDDVRRMAGPPAAVDVADAVARTPQVYACEGAVDQVRRMAECAVNGEHSAGLAVPEQDEDLGDEEEEDDDGVNVEEHGGGGGEEKPKGLAEKAADPQVATATVATEQVS